MLKPIGILVLAVLLAAPAAQLQAASKNYFLEVEDEYVRIAFEFVKKLSEKKR